MSPEETSLCVSSPDHFLDLLLTQYICQTQQKWPQILRRQCCLHQDRLWSWPSPPSLGSETASWGHELTILVSASHLLVTINCSSNFAIYCAKVNNMINMIIMIMSSNMTANIHKCTWIEWWHKVDTCKIKRKTCNGVRRKVHLVCIWFCVKFFRILCNPIPQYIIF